MPTRPKPRVPGTIALPPSRRTERDTTNLRRAAARVSAGASLRQLMTQIKTRLRVAGGEQWEIGKLLNRIDRDAAVALFGAPNFPALVETELELPYRSAQRFMEIAAHYPKAQASQLGVEKAYQLRRYVELSNGRSPASELARRNARIGRPPRAISDLSAAQIEMLARVAALNAAPPAPKPSGAERRAVRQFEARFEDIFGIDAAVRVDKKTGRVRVEFALEDLLDD